MSRLEFYERILYSFDVESAHYSLLTQHGQCKIMANEHQLTFEYVSPEQAIRFFELARRATQLNARLIQKVSAEASGKDFNINDTMTIWSAFSRTTADILENPTIARGVQQAIMSAFLDSSPAGESGTLDRRFRGADWENDLFSKSIRDWHVAMESMAEQALSALPKGSKDYLRVQFYTRQLFSALAPSNFLFLNPAARQKFLDTKGSSLLDGFENLLDDLERGDGRLEIKTNDGSAFVVGQDLANTQGKIVFENDLMQLIQYEPRTEKQFRRPLLLVPAWINKFYIFDLQPKNSFVRYLLDRGHTVFVISWVNPDERHADKSFESYMTEGPLAALDAIKDATDEDTVNILGFCIGGILVTATAAYLAALGDKRLGSVTTLATMIDFRDVGEIGAFIDRDRLKALRSHMAEKGYLESFHLQDMFSMIRENDLVWSYHVNNYLLGRKPPAFDLLFWNSDSTRLPADMLLWYLEKIYIENALRVPDALSIQGVPIDVTKITAPCYVLATKEDHIAPWTSVYPTTRLVKDVTFVLGGSGHIAGVINPPSSKPKYGFWTASDYPADPEDWLEAAEHTAGSWWKHWGTWVDELSPKKQVLGRKPGSGKLEVLENAPGQYVLGDGDAR